MRHVRGSGALDVRWGKRWMAGWLRDVPGSGSVDNW